MAYRIFTSPEGEPWQAWDVPGRPPAGIDLTSPVLEQGWICFESRAEKRRLTPIPSRWFERSEAELWLYCRVAEPVAAVARPPGLLEPPPAV